MNANPYFFAQQQQTPRVKKTQKKKEYVTESEYSEDESSGSETGSSSESGSSCSSSTGSYTGSEATTSSSGSETGSETDTECESVEEKKVVKKEKKSKKDPLVTKVTKVTKETKKEEAEAKAPKTKKDKKSMKETKDTKVPVRTEKTSKKKKPVKTSVQEERSSKEVEERTLQPPAQSTPSVSPGQYIFGVISNVIDSGDKKSFKGILTRTPLPVVLHYLHHIAHRAISTGNKEMEKVILSMNKKYNIVSDVYIDAFRKGDSRMINMVMDYFSKTVEAFKNTRDINADDLLKHFTPEFISMNIIQSGNIELYDSVMSGFKRDDLVITRGYHSAKPLIAAYFGIKKFFSNQKRYTFNREIFVLAICGGDTETLDYIVKKTKGKTVTDDIALEARSCHPITPEMSDHLVNDYEIDEM